MNQWEDVLKGIHFLSQDQKCRPKIIESWNTYLRDFLKSLFIQNAILRQSTTKRNPTLWSSVSTLNNITLLCQCIQARNQFPLL